MKKKIIFSFDYELFFGIKSGTVQKTLIEPTNLLLDCMDSVGAKGNFFIDYLMFERLEQLDDERAKSDLCLIKDQVKDMVRRGHRIELHLHPHWIDAKYNGDGTWDYSDFTHYSLYSLSKEEIARLFREGTSYLTNLAREVDPDYTIIAFRAGGWTIQPFGIVKNCFIENGIKIDSSVMYGICQDNKYSKFDFRNAPNKEYYHFSDDVCVEDSTGEITEVPITSLHVPFLFFIYERLTRKFTSYFSSFADGTHFRKDQIALKKSIKNKIFEKFSVSYRMICSLAVFHPISILYDMKTSKRNIYCLIDHPKDICRGSLNGIRCLKRICESISYEDLI